MATKRFFHLLKWKKMLAAARHFFIFLHGLEYLGQTLGQKILFFLIQKEPFFDFLQKKRV